MIIPSNRSAKFDESLIREMTRIALEEDAINLSQGLPDFAPPQVLIDAAKSAIGSTNDQYSITYGDAGLRSAISEDLFGVIGHRYDPESEITVTCGVSEGIIAAIMAVVNPGDEVVFFEPYYENYLPGIIFAGGIPVPVELHPPKWEFRLDTFRNAITSKTRAVIINSPMNPTGKIFSSEELSMLTEICARNDIIVISDEIYRHITYAGKHESPAGIDGFNQQTIVAGGFSKVFSCTGWRVGYTAARGELAKAVRKVHDYLTICAPHPFQIGVLAGLKNLPAEYYENLRTNYIKKRDLLCYGLMDLGFKLELPKGAYYVLADFSEISDINDMTFTGRLAVNGGVAVVPGSSFYVKGRKGQNLIRFSFAVTEEKIIQALDRIGERIKIIN